MSILLKNDNTMLIEQMNNSNLFLTIAFICIFGYILTKIWKSLKIQKVLKRKIHNLKSRLENPTVH